MAKDKLTEYSATNASNDVIGDISVAEGMLPSAVNNALREQMTHLKNFSDGTDAIDALAVDNLKLDGNTISSTDTNGNVNIDPNGTGNTIITSNSLLVGNGQNISWGGSYSSGYPTVYATSSSGGYIAFAPNGNAPSTNQVRIVNDGIEFGAASSNLNDYEEGTWTPIDSSGAGLTFSVVTASYVKIGKTCTVHAYINFPATSSAADVLIGGLPFTTVGYGAFAVNSNVNGAHIIQLQTGATNYRIKNQTNAGFTNAQFSGSFNVFSGTYIIA